MLGLGFDEGEKWNALAEVEFGHDREVQTFSLDDPARSTTTTKLVFDDCTNFYARTTICELKVYGNNDTL